MWTYHQCERWSSLVLLTLVTEVLNSVGIKMFTITDNEIASGPITGIIFEVLWMYGIIRREETQDNWFNTVQQSKSGTLCSTTRGYI